MAGVYLDNIVMTRESKSFIDSLHAILTAANLFSGPKYMLSGLSGMAFKFTVHERLLPMSVTAYGQWGVEHQPAIDNLGIYTLWDGGRSRHPTFRVYQQDAVRAVTASLDRGIGVLYWIPEFGVICGYDDEDRVLFVQNGISKDSQVILYDNFGLNKTPFWYVQLMGDKVTVSLEEMTLEALRLAIQDWEVPHKTLPNTDIASGRMAYSFLKRALDKGDYDEYGAVYILESYQVSRSEIMCFLRDVRHVLPSLDDACARYEQLVERIADMSECMATSRGKRQVNRASIPALVEMLTAAEALEEQAVDHFKEISRSYPDLKRSIVPRWGSHSPR
ncbi:hypothetical protein [Paenibacillus marinisediminis]